MLIAETCEPGLAQGEMSLPLKTTPTSTVRALMPSTSRHAADPATFIRQNPDTALQMAVTLARRVDSLGRYLVEIKNQFKDRADQLGMIDEVLDSLMKRQPRNMPRRATGD